MGEKYFEYLSAEERKNRTKLTLYSRYRYPFLGLETAEYAHRTIISCRVARECVSWEPFTAGDSYEKVNSNGFSS